MIAEYIHQVVVRWDELFNGVIIQDIQIWLLNIFIRWLYGGMKYSTVLLLNVYKYDCWIHSSGGRTVEWNIHWCY